MPWTLSQEARWSSQGPYRLRRRAALTKQPHRSGVHLGAYSRRQTNLHQHMWNAVQEGRDQLWNPRIARSHCQLWLWGTPVFWQADASTDLVLYLDYKRKHVFWMVWHGDQLPSAHQWRREKDYVNVDLERGLDKLPFTRCPLGLMHIVAFRFFELLPTSIASVIDGWLSITPHYLYLLAAFGEIEKERYSLPLTAFSPFRDKSPFWIYVHVCFSNYVSYLRKKI